MADAQSDSLSTTSQQEQPKFYKGMKVFAKDNTSGILYESVVRRTMYGVARQRQKPVHEYIDRDDEHDEEEEQPEWHCFVHYMGWNVKWDRWVSEGSLYEITDKTRELAQKLQEAVRDAKRKYGKGPQVMLELAQRMKRLEQERRLEERREELAKQGIVMKEEEEEATASKNRQHSFTKASFQKELSLREERDLQGRRKQVHAEKLPLPFTLKKILVEEWEIITQCHMVPTLPAAITVQQVLDQYLASKVTSNDQEALTADSATEAVEKPATSKPDSETAASAALPKPNQVFLTADEMVVNQATEPTTMITDISEDGDLKIAAVHERDEGKPDATNDSSEKKQTQEWKDMVDGITLLFDQALTSHLLYRQELPQHEWIQQHDEFGRRPNCQIYGGEHLLRLFVRLPAMLADQLSDAESRPIFSRLNDLARYLQKHSSTLFLQTYHTPPEEEQSRKRPAGNTKRRAPAKRSRKAAVKKEDPDDVHVANGSTSSSQECS